MSYNRKYYLHRQVRKSGFELKINRTFKTINIKPDLAEIAKTNKYVSELKNKYSYGVQYINQLFGMI